MKHDKSIKIISSIWAALAVLFYMCLSVSASDYQFDANYYARKYPDVVAVLGSDPKALANHYATSGVAEGRFCSQAEESYYFANGLTKAPSVPVIEQATPQSTTPPEPSADNQSILPLAVEPKFNTYVDVDITNQVVTYFEDKVVKLQTPCVTGLANGKRDTPTGTYTIKTHETNRYLVGPTWKSYVHYWMRFTDSACGLHDATWRSSFGGDIYKTNGSHGCVNLPKDAAASLYDMVNVGTIVYVH